MQVLYSEICHNRKQCVIPVSKTWFFEVLNMFCLLYDTHLEVLKHLQMSVDNTNGAIGVTCTCICCEYIHQFIGNCNIHDKLFNDFLLHI